VTHEDKKIGGKIFFISESLSAPFDEGIKNVAFSMHQQLEDKTRSLSVTGKGSNTDGLRIVRVGLNKLFLNNELRRQIKKYSPDIIIYLPEASITFNSFIRAKVMNLMKRKAKVAVIGVKSANYSSFQREIIVRFLRPDLLFLAGRFDDGFFRSRGLKVKILPPAVDNIRFCQAKSGEKERIRTELHIPLDKTVVLHVGHIRSTRNVESLSEIQKIDNVQVVVVGSSSTPTEHDLKKRLTKEGVLVIDEFVQDISKIYKMSDIYVFPVLNEIACIEMPLSVLEAMACNLPVITTKFGSLKDYFEEDSGFRYADSIEDMVNLIRIVKDMAVTDYCNNKKIKSFTWSKFADEVIAACDELQ
jgi:glycosyltransferase involved in cell wall biosynthesis